MKMHVAAVMAAALLALPHGAMAQSGTLERIESSGKMRIGYRQSEPPMSFAENGGDPVGYTIDICMRIATAVKEKLGRSDITLDFVPVTAADRFTALTDDQIDILCGSTTKTLSRSELVDFTQLTFVTGAALLSLDEARVESVLDLQGKKVGVVHDTTTIDVLEKVLKDGLIEAEIVSVDSAADAVHALREGGNRRVLVRSGRPGRPRLDVEGARQFLCLVRIVLLRAVRSGGQTERCRLPPGGGSRDLATQSDRANRRHLQQVVR